MNEIMISPVYQEKTDEISRLRTSLSMIIMERDELQYVICRNLQTEYMMKLGDLEYKVFQAMCEYKKAKRRCEMIRSYVNRGMKPDHDWIREQLEIEFLEYTEKLNQKLKQMNDAISHHNGRMLSGSETKELKDLYRKLVKRLHPDMNPELGEEALRLFHNAVEAYSNGDLGTLRIIDILSQDLSRTLKEVTFEEQKNDLLEAIERVKEDIVRIKSKFPYTAKTLLEDAEEIERRRNSLRKQIEDYDSAREEYEMISRNAVMS